MPAGRDHNRVTSAASDANLRKLEAAGARILKVESLAATSAWRALMRKLGKRRGCERPDRRRRQVAASALTEGIVDKVMAFVAPKIIGGESAKTPVEGHGDREDGRRARARTDKLANRRLRYIDRGDIRVHGTSRRGRQSDDRSRKDAGAVTRGRRAARVGWTSARRQRVRQRRLPDRDEDIGATLLASTR